MTEQFCICCLLSAFVFDCFQISCIS